MRQQILAGITLSLTGLVAHADLLGRAPLTAGGTDYQAYYDTDLNITWLADANLAGTETFGLDYVYFFSEGNTNWTVAQRWINALNGAEWLGLSNWRLPIVTDTGTPGCNYANLGTDCGWNVDPATGELAHLFYTTLGNQSGVDTHGANRPCLFTECWTNTGPFSNVYGIYWYRTRDALDSGKAWIFIDNGAQDTISTGIPQHMWPVSPGDQLAVPLPAAGWLLAPAFNLTGWRYRRNADRRH